MESPFVSALNIDLVSADHGPLYLRASGDLDRGSSDAFRSSLDGLLVRGRPIVVDLTGLDFLDSSGLGALLVAHRAAAALGIDLRIVGEHGSVARLLRRTGTLTMLTG